MSMTIGKEARQELHRIATFSDDSQARQLLRSFLDRCTDADESEQEPLGWTLYDPSRGSVLGGFWLPRDRHNAESEAGKVSIEMSRPIILLALYD